MTNGLSKTDPGFEEFKKQVLGELDGHANTQWRPNMRLPARILGLGREWAARPSMLATGRCTVSAAPVGSLTAPNGALDGPALSHAGIGRRA